MALHIGTLLIDGERMNPRVEDNLVEIEVLRTMDGASTLTLTVHDPEGDLLESGALTRRRRSKPRRGLEEAAWDRLGRTTIVYGRSATATPAAFRLRGASARGSNTILRCEDEIFSILRGDDKPLVISRDDYTRAQFVWWMVQKGARRSGRPIATYIPHRRVTRRERKPEQLTARKKDLREVRVNGALLDAEQRRNLDLIMAACEEENAGERPTLALIEACIVEPSAPPAKAFYNPTFGHSTSVGMLQLLDSHLGGSASTNGGRRDIKLVCRMFLRDGFAKYSPKGAIELAKLNPDWSPGEIAQACQGSAFPDRYEEHRSEADEIYGLYGGVSGDGEVRVTVDDQFLFFRGQPGGGKENSVQAATRLANEVRHRFFTANNVLMYLQDNDLFRSRPLLTVAPQPKAAKPERGVFYVGEFEYEWDAGKPVSEVSFRAPVEELFAYPGAVTEIRRPRPIDGRWLTWSILERATTDMAEVTLRRPQPALPEPATPTSTVTLGGTDDGRPVGNARERVLRFAEASLTVHTGHRYYSQPGALTANPTADPPNRSDCSQWTRAIFLKAGLPDIGLNTWEQSRKGRRTSRPLPGDLMFTGDTGHVEIYVGGDKTYGHGSPPIDEGSVDYFRSTRGVYFVTFSFLDEDTSERRSPARREWNRQRDRINGVIPKTEIP